MTVLFKGYVSRLPPSTNRMYVHTRRGPVQSKEAKQYKARTKLELAEQIKLTYTGPKDGVAYKLTMVFHLPVLENKGWPGKAKSRYKRRDVSNMIKVIEDVLSDSLGVDDSNFLRVDVEKVQAEQGVEDGGVSIQIEEYSHERDGIVLE